MSDSLSGVGRKERAQRESEIQDSCKTDAFWFRFEKVPGPSMSPVLHICAGTCQTDVLTT